ncbi:HPr-rel-A system PqqD family peptide chaperone [Candidatus Riflebacteria bacterium]
MKLSYNFSRLKEMALSESGFLFDPSSGFTFTLNSTGTSIFRLLQKGKEKEEILNDIQDEFETPGENELEQDFEDFVYRLREVGLLIARQELDDERQNP